MIDITPQIVELVRSVDALGGRVYRKWPQTRAEPPYAVVDRIGRSVVQTDGEGRELIVSLTYSVDVMARSPSELDAIEDEITDLLAPYHMHTTGSSPMWETTAHSYRRSLTYTGSVDLRGNVFI